MIDYNLLGKKSTIGFGQNIGDGIKDYKKNQDSINFYKNIKNVVKGVGGLTAGAGILYGINKIPYYNNIFSKLGNNMYDGYSMVDNSFRKIGNEYYNNLKENYGGYLKNPFLNSQNTIQDKNENFETFTLKKRERPYKRLKVLKSDSLLPLVKISHNDNSQNKLDVLSNYFTSSSPNIINPNSLLVPDISSGSLMPNITNTSSVLPNYNFTTSDNANKEVLIPPDLLSDFLIPDNVILNYKTPSLENSSSRFTNDSENIISNVLDSGNNLAANTLKVLDFVFTPFKKNSAFNEVYGPYWEEFLKKKS